MNSLISRTCVFLFLFFAVLPLFSETIVFLHSNDTHGIYKPIKIKTKDGEKWVGGMEATCHYINTIREKEEHVFFVDTGDIMTGTLATELMHKDVIGGLMIEFLNHLGCDVWCFGNHEFDLGLENALGLAGLADFPTLMSNIVYKDSGKPIPVEPYHISNAGGAYKWYCDNEKCQGFWVRNLGACLNCVRVCPFNKPEGRIHDAARFIVRNASWLDPVLLRMNKAFGYGKRAKGDSYWE